MRRRIRPPRRPGFTLVELMVAMALIVFIMYVLAEAFSAGAKTFRDLKAVGDMNSRLRTATTLLRQYLAADHFEGRKRLSDPNFWSDGPPKQGFFRIWQDSNPTDEGKDLDDEHGGSGNNKYDDENHSYHTFFNPAKPNDPVGHHLHFTVRLRGERQTDYFRATVPTGSPLLALPEPLLRFQESDQFRSQWAEVVIFLKRASEQTDDPNGDTTKGSPLELYTLHLQQRLLVPSDKDVKDANMGNSLPDTEEPNYSSEVSCMKVPDPNDASKRVLYFNGPDDVSMPARRYGNNPVNEAYPTSPGALARFPDGSDVLLTDVVSFDVRVLLAQSAYAGTAREEFITLFSPHAESYRMMLDSDTTKTANSELPSGIRVFDTWSSRKDDRYNYTGWSKTDQQSKEAIPMFKKANSNEPPIQIKAIQITLRIWDARTKQTRQVSIVQDM